MIGHLNFLSSFKRITQLLCCFVLLFLISCKEKSTTASSSSEIVWKDPGTPIKIQFVAKADTIKMQNAPARITRKIKNDNNGLLFAAYEDIIAYDGTSFNHLPKNLNSWDAFDVLKDHKGNIWVGSTHFGVFQIKESNNSNKEIRPLTFDDGLSHNRTMCLHEDKVGNIWIGTEDGITIIDGLTSEKEDIKFDYINEVNGLTNTNINFIMEDKQGKVWVGNRGNLCVSDDALYAKNSKMTFSEFKDGAGNTFANIWSIAEAKNGDIWLGGQGGLWQISNGITKKHLSIGVMGVLEDSSGNIWLTHSGRGAHSAGLSCFMKVSPIKNPL